MSDDKDNRHVLKKKRCNNCSRKPGLLSNCKYCDHSYCFACIQQEVHLCKGLDAMKREHLNRLSEKLHNERVVKRKIEVI